MTTHESAAEPGHGECLGITWEPAYLHKSKKWLNQQKNTVHQAEQ